MSVETHGVNCEVRPAFFILSPWMRDQCNLVNERVKDTNSRDLRNRMIDTDYVILR